MVQFKGAGRRLTQGDIEDAVRLFNNPKITEAHIRTIMEVESNGKPYDSMGHPTFLFEGHVFYSRLEAKSAAKLKTAIAQGVAFKDWKGPGTYGKTVQIRWKNFQKALAIDEQVAIESASWGIGQVMGYHFKGVGYSSPQEMVEAFADSERQQLFALCNYVITKGLTSALAGFPVMASCRQFALRYNGKLYEKNNYHNKLANAYKRWSARIAAAKSSEPKIEDGILQVGSKGDRVANLQKMLDDRGYEMIKYGGKFDGKFGPNTRAAVLAWQADNGRPTDGSMDAADMEALEDSPHRPISNAREDASKAEVIEVSPAAASGDKIQKIAVGTGVVTAGAEVADQTGLLDVGTRSWSDQLQETSGIFYSVKGMMDAVGITTVVGLIADHPFIVIAIVCALIYYFAGDIIQNRIKAIREGKAAS